MSEWLTPTCQWLAAVNGTASAIICGVLAALLVTVIALGFGPLRSWIGRGAAGDPSSHGSMGQAYGLLATLRLYRQLGRADPAMAGFFAPSVPAFRVPHPMGESIHNESSAPDLASTLSKIEQSVTGTGR